VPRLPLVREDVLEDTEQLCAGDRYVDLLGELASYGVDRTLAELDRSAEWAAEGLVLRVVVTLEHEDLVAISDHAERHRPGQGSGHQIPTTPRCCSSLRS
jgi:hypothetical protein